MPKTSSLVLSLFAICYLLFASPAFAADDPVSENTDVTATVPSTTATTSDTLAPTAPILIAPHDGAITNQRRPEFVWRQSSDPNGNTVLYTLILNGTATFLGISNTGSTQTHNYITHLGDGNVYLTPTFDLSAGEYDWRVDASDLSGNVSHSATWHFTVDLTAPFLQLLSINHEYDSPDLTNNPTFELRGPKDVSLYLATEPWATISITISTDSTVIYQRSFPTNQTGLTSPPFHLTPGLYTVEITSFDHAGLTTILPSFSLNITQSTLTVPIPFGPTYELPLTPYIFPSLPSLPATITQITSRSNLAFYLLILLALLITSLLILFWYHPVNLLILDASTHKPYRSLILYHSRPNTHLHRRVFVSNQAPIYYHLSPSRAFIPSLGRYSTLTIRIGTTTHILSLAYSARTYIIEI